MSDNNTSERKPLILIAEDVESNYKLLEIILKKEYDLLWAKNGKEAVEYAFAEHPDAVLMDVRMPVMGGLEATRQIRKMSPDVPIIAMSAYSYGNEPELAREAGCNDFLTKPLSQYSLNKILNAALVDLKRK